jgi:molybdenum cofactor guanylyltransferase
MPQFPNIEGFILAGGKSSRMGRDKALLEFGGKTNLQRTADLIAPLVSRVSLVTSAPAANDAASLFAQLKLPIIADRWPGAGPLGGIATALASARLEWCVILACDLPYLTKDWLEYLPSKAEESEADSIVPESARGMEPLCAVYRSACAAKLAEALERGARKVTDALAELHVERIREAEWHKFSADGLLFHNMNTWQDYVEAKKRLEG